MTYSTITNEIPSGATSGDPGRPKVLIVGAGLAGLTLGMILQQSDIPYEIFESAPAIKPVGAAMVFGPTLAPMFKQCGIYDEFVALGKKNESINVLNSKGGKEYSVDFTDGKEMFGEDGYILTRPIIYDLIYRQIPKDRIHLGKKILATDQDSHCVTIKCSDGLDYKGDILVGAQGTIAWGVIEYLPAEATREDQDYRRADWGPEAALAFCEKVRDLPVKSGGNKIMTIGDLIDVTPKEQINKVRLEEKIFETWHYGRTVLIGDACHKFTPAGGVGATNAMHDAVVLANWIHALPNNASAKEINHAFQAYQSERMPWVQEAFKQSRAFQVTNSKGYLGKMIRFGAKHMPTWMQRRAAISMNINRPQVRFLSRADDTGSVKPAPQISLDARIPLPSQETHDSALAI
ncbi:hypothetical protein BGZ96_004330 [Linnemannia gamsii]|uniref:FAD-binding domain-containing protein n=1 Tax=Linnemannia gamsii TaxID=64522 RepID=A0ABQ7JI98_9FUNG|nr:hypothetical protein BGZ96_004330 [Linnemannia gamsii]